MGVEELVSKEYGEKYEDVFYVLVRSRQSYESFDFRHYY
jgi:hypothetical protein